LRVHARHSAASPAVTTAHILCQSDAQQFIQCWAGTDEYVTGNAGNPSGLRTNDGKMHVFAGLRDDPFFFTLTGGKATPKIVPGAASSLKFDPAGCPALDAATANVLVT